MEDVIKYWGLAGNTLTPIESPSKSTWDIDGKYILKRVSDADEFSRSLRFSELLTVEGIPVAQYIPIANGQFTSPDGSYCLMTKLPGSHADFFETPELACEMGRELACLHKALLNVEPKIVCTDSDFLSDWRNHIKSTLIGLVPDDIIANIESRFTELYPQLPRQLIHRDVHNFNVLFDNGHLTGWLDFDLGQRNVRLFDIAYLLGGLLIGEQHNPARVNIWRALYHSVLLGYDEKNPLIAEEREALPVLMVTIELLFVSFWMQRENCEQRDKALDLANWLYGEYMSK